MLWLSVGPTGVYLLDFFILLRYSVLFTVESLSLLYLLVISWFICFRRWCIALLGVFHAKPNIYVSWSTSELRVRLAQLNWFKPSSKIFYWPFQGGTPFKALLFFLSCVCYVFVRVCLYVLCCQLLGKGWPLGSRLWCLWICHFPIGILGQVTEEWYLIVSIPDLCTLTYFKIFICKTALFLISFQCLSWQSESKKDAYFWFCWHFWVHLLDHF